MIDIDTARSLRESRQVMAIACVLCFAAVVAPWRIPSDVVLGIFTIHCFLRVLEYSTRLRELELDANGLSIHERRQRMKK